MQAEKSSQTGFLTWARGKLFNFFYLEVLWATPKDREGTAYLSFSPVAASPRTAHSPPQIFFSNERSLRLKQRKVCPQVANVPTLDKPVSSGTSSTLTHRTIHSCHQTSCSHTSKLCPCTAPVSLVSTLWYPPGNGIVNSIMMYTANMCPAPQLGPGWILADRAKEIRRVHVTCSVPLYWQKPSSGFVIISRCFTIVTIWRRRQRVDAEEEVKSRACKTSEAKWGR